MANTYLDFNSFVKNLKKSDNETANAFNTYIFIRNKCNTFQDAKDAIDAGILNQENLLDLLEVLPDICMEYEEYEDILNQVKKDLLSATSVRSMSKRLL